MKSFLLYDYAPHTPMDSNTASGALSSGISVFRSGGLVRISPGSDAIHRGDWHLRDLGHMENGNGGQAETSTESQLRLFAHSRKLHPAANE